MWNHLYSKPRRLGWLQTCLLACMGFLPSVLQARRILLCSESEHLASLYPGLFSHPHSMQIKKKTSCCSSAQSIIILLCEMGGALYIPIAYPLTTQIMGPPGKGKLLLLWSQGSWQTRSSPQQCSSCLAGTKCLLCKDRHPLLSRAKSVVACVSNTGNQQSHK